MREKTEFIPHPFLKKGPTMMQRSLMTGFLTVSAGFWLASFGGADDTRAADKVPVNDLSMEVAALKTLHYLQPTRTQLEALRKLSKDTVDKQAGKETSKASEKYRQTLTDLRAALAAANDDERIDELIEQLEDLQETEKLDLDDMVEVTDEARDKAPAALRLFSAHQVVSYLANFADDLPDPLERLLESLGKVRGVPAKDWEKYRDDLSAELGKLLGGLDSDKAGRVANQVVQLLIVARGLKDEEVKTQRAELEKMARDIVDTAGPTDVMRNVMEQHLAELLSNPRLPAALAARLN